MRLVSLKIVKSLDGSVIRDVKFNKQGLSLVVDKDSKEGRSGNNLGKTTFAKLIDLALGGSHQKILYTGPDQSVNRKLKTFIDDNLIYVELAIEKMNGDVIVLRRDLFQKGKSFINGERCKKLNDYKDKLKIYLFSGAEEENVTFRELCPFFIRYGERLNTIFRYLDKFSADDKYILCYRVLMALSKRDDVDLRQFINEKKDENNAILKKTGAVDFAELESKANAIKSELEKTSSTMKSDEVVVGFSKEADHAAQEKTIGELSSKVSSIELEISVFESKIDDEKLSLSPIDGEALSVLYGEVSHLLSLKIDFEELVEFHKKMVFSRIERYKEKLLNLKIELETNKKELQNAKKKYADQFVDYKYCLNESTNSFFEKIVDLKAKLMTLEKAIAKYRANDEAIAKAKESLEQIKSQGDDDERKKEIVADFFRDASIELLGEENNLEYTNEGFPVKLEAEDNGDGNIKVLISGFAYALNHLYETLNLDRPNFLVEDAMENVSLNYLGNLIQFSRGKKMQLIIPILYDRVQTLQIDDKDVILYLSKTDKLFRI